MASGKLTLKHKGQLKNVAYFQSLILLIVLLLVNLRMQKNRQNCIFFCMRQSFLNLLSLDLTALQLGELSTELCRLGLPLGKTGVLDIPY